MGRCGSEHLRRHGAGQYDEDAPEHLSPAHAFFVFLRNRTLVRSHGAPEEPGRPGTTPHGYVPNVYQGQQVILTRNGIPLVTMPEELRQLLMEWHTVPVATAGPDGKPGVAGKSVMVLDPETVVWGELYFGQTYENLKQDPRASLCVWKRTLPTKAWRVNGTVVIHENDETASRLDERVRASHKNMFKARRDKMAAVYFTVEEIYDQTPDLEAAGKRIG